MKGLKTRCAEASDRHVPIRSDPERRTVPSLKNKVLSPSPEVASVSKCNRWDVFTGRYATGMSRTSPQGWVYGVPVEIYRWFTPTLGKSNLIKVFFVAIGYSYRIVTSLESPVHSVFPSDNK